MQSLRLGFVLLTLVAMAGTSNASDDALSTSQKPAIGGYSVVSYFENDRAELGSEQFRANYQGKTYWFVSSKQTETFKQNPQKYVPLFDAFCPFSLTLGMKLPIDPQNFKITAGRLMLFHVNESKNALVEWNKAEDEDALLRRANREYLRLSL